VLNAANYSGPGGAASSGPGLSEEAARGRDLFSDSVRSSDGVLLDTGVPFTDKRTSPQWTPAFDAGPSSLPPTVTCGPADARGRNDQLRRVRAKVAIAIPASLAAPDLIGIYSRRTSSLPAKVA
jgi:hypothetical protein